ncbi:hypothetical protein Tco_0228424 [Tanacetum coccineum]
MDTANSLLSSFASKVKNIDDRVLAKDGKPIEDTTSKSMVKIVELSNDEIVKGDDVIDTPYLIDLNKPYGSAEYLYVVLSLQNTPYRLGEQDTLFRLQKLIRCLVIRFDTSYPTGGYPVSGDLPEQNTLKTIK